MLKDIYHVVLIIFMLAYPKLFAQELRGTWIARDQLSTKEALATAMDTIAKNNFNVVYVNVWSRGYPLWQSDVFYKYTGLKIDPDFTGRDILAEAIAEGHKHGLHVEAWFEYGFVGGYELYYPGNSGKGKIFDSYPGWVAKRQDGGEKDKSNFYWMVQTRKDVQDFIIALCAEMIRKYDLDGIELDRIRYSSLQYGYDQYTDSLYRAEHGGNPLPANYADASFIRWRADKLNQFAARIYDSLKTINPKLNISNAPSLYSSSSYTSYLNFCQDWAWWVNNNKIDNVQLQMYVTSPSLFASILDYAQTLVPNKSKVYPAFAVAPSGSPLPLESIFQFIDITRTQKFRGNAIWYYTDLRSFFSGIKSNRYNEKTYPPFSNSTWREIKKIVGISNSADAVRYGNWFNSLIYGYDGPSIYANSIDSASVSYFANVPANGFYEIYAFIPTGADRAENAEYIVYDSAGVENRIYVNQSNVNNKRWYKLGDYKLNSGRNLIAVLSNSGVAPGKRISADALMIKLNRRLSPNILTSIEYENDINHRLEPRIYLKNYPNPFNNQTTISFDLPETTKINLSVYNSLGERLFIMKQLTALEGLNEIKLDTSSFPSGVYFCSIEFENKRYLSKILLLK
jgi:uncharacterized lipoprotein YddW (UPF0748 family)